jgi:catechol 2,3-dioxygenase-like lactoylglutathione lyase family enzyme
MRFVIETQGLTHINLLVADIHRAKAFYETVFGFEEMFWQGAELVFLRPPGTNDTVTLQMNPEGAGAAGNIDHFGFRLTDKSQLDRAIAEVIEAGGRLVERGEHAPGAPYAYVADPDGHIIEF